MLSKSISKHVISWGHAPRPPIALACFVQHNKHKRLLKSDLGQLCTWLNWKKFGPLTIKHLPTPMSYLEEMIYWVIYTGVYTNNTFSTSIMRGLKILEVVQFVKLKVQHTACTPGWVSYITAGSINTVKMWYVAMVYCQIIPVSILKWFSQVTIQIQTNMLV